MNSRQRAAIQNSEIRNKRETHQIDKLPTWAAGEIARLREVTADLLKALETMVRAHPFKSYDAGFGLAAESAHKLARKAIAKAKGKA